MKEQRDIALGARLDELDVFEHGEGYWEAVEELIDERREDEASQLGHVGGRFRRGRLLIAALGVAAMVLAVVFGTRLTGTNEVGLGNEPASAAGAIRLSLDALTKAEAIEGSVRLFDNGFSEDGSTVLAIANTFVAAKDGSMRLDTIPGEPSYYMSIWGSDARMTMVYDAQTRKQQSLVDAGEAGTTIGDNDETRYRYLWYQKRNVAPGPPDSGSNLEPLPLWRLRAYLRTLLSMKSAELEVTSVEGRATWVVRAPYVVGTQRYEATVAIDAETRLPYSLVYRINERKIEWRFDLSVRSTPVDQRSFSLDAPPADQSHTNAFPGWDNVNLYTFVDLPVSDDARTRRLTAAMPTVPAWLPEGFVLQDATVTNGREGVFVVSLLYRRGFDRIVVTTRPDPRLFTHSTTSVDGGPRVRTDTSDPFIPTMTPGARAAWREQTLRVPLTSGGFAGSSARIVTDPQYWPHLWAKKDGVVATVAGDLTIDEMVRVAESLRPWGE